jgi:alpha-tubulin suppressor-like RCC1 family protein
MGALGTDPSVTMDEFVPTKTSMNVPSPVAVAAGPGFTCVTQLGGGVFCWGTDPARNYDPMNWKGASVSGQGSADIVAAGGPMPPFVCASSSGKVSCWGNNENDQLGIDSRTTPMSMTPGPAIPGLTGVSALAAGVEFTCALANGRAWCWGNNVAGQIGLDPSGPPTDAGTPPNQSFVPIEVKGW